MKFKLRHLSIILSVFAFFNLNATALTPEAALARCYKSGNIKTCTAMPRFETTDLIKTSTFGDDTHIYIFSNDSSGYAIVNGEDISAPLLGYGASNFTNGKIPPNMLWWIEQYGNELESLKHYTQNRDNTSENSIPTYSNIYPLCKTQWGQVPPYNNDCPKIEDKSTYTGCVATSMAQLIKYHNWPAQGTGSHSYTWNDTELSVNFSDLQFDWSQMLNNYKGEYTEQQATEVAKLMYACGVAVDMKYGTSSSSAHGEYQAKALIDYFSYGNCTTLLERENFYLSDWIEIIYNSLKAGAPVAYMGTGRDGGHAFTVDGYSDGYFHINWGWTGDANGYFLITILNPYEDIIWESFGYRNDQKAVVYALPNTTCNTPYVVMSNTSTLSGSYDTDDNKLTLIGNFTYYGSAAAEVPLGIMLSDGKNEPIYYKATTRTLDTNDALQEISVNITRPNTGIYTVSPVYEYEGTWHEMSAPVGISQSSKMTVTDDAVIISSIDGQPLTIENIVQHTPFYQGCYFQLTFDLVNANDFEQSDEIWVCMVNNNQQIMWNWDPIIRVVDTNSSLGVTVEQQLPYFNFTGECLVAMYRKVGDEYQQIASQTVDLQKLAGEDFRFGGTNVEILNPTEVSDTLHFSYTINNVLSFYDYRPHVAVFDESNTKVLRRAYNDFDFILEGETKTFTRELDISSLNVGETYTLNVYSRIGDPQQKDEYLPKIGSATFVKSVSGVGIIDNDYDDIQVCGLNIIAPSYAKIYDIKGMRVAPNNLSPGLYIVTLGSHTVKIAIQ